MLEINYPDALDTDDNLFLVHDFLRLALVRDYTPGDSTIYVNTQTEVYRRFPATGLITLTDQCAELDERAVSFYYGTKTEDGFTDLTILPGFTDVAKPKQFTNVLQNVMAQHHNNLKDAIIAIQRFCGIRGLVDQVPFGPTLEGRINFLRKLVLSPRAWFDATPTIGLVPFTVTFTDRSFRLGTDGAGGTIEYIWDFGDGTTSTVAQNQPISMTPGSTIEHTYTTPGIYDVTLTVRNQFGENTLRFGGLIQARLPAPEPAAIQIVPLSNQILTPGDPELGPYVTPPVLRTPVNTFVTVEIPEGENPETPGVSYGGESLDSQGNPEDPIVFYTWSMTDDLIHNNSATTRAMYSVGGMYDITLRVDTLLKAYRITFLQDALDVVENVNLWLWTYVPDTLTDVDVDQAGVRAYEYGLISETFKVKNTTVLTIDQDSSFLDGEANSTQQIREFLRNVFVTPRTTTPSGVQGTAFIFNATGRSALDPVSAEAIQTTEYNGFTDVYLTPYTPISRPWNWVPLSNGSTTYFLLGYPTDTILPNSSPTNQEKMSFDHLTAVTTAETWTLANYTNGAQELMNNPATYDPVTGDSNYGNFSGYRTAWKDLSGYILRNDGVGPFYRLMTFYKTEGTLGDPVTGIKKLPSMPGSARVEGQLVTLSSGVFFFNNSGAVNAYNDISGVWETSSGTSSFRLLQDSSVSGFDSASNTLLAASDGDKKVYLSYDYSTKAFIRFNAADLTFSKLGSRPSGEQWAMSIW